MRWLKKSTIVFQPVCSVFSTKSLSAHLGSFYWAGQESLIHPTFKNRPHVEFIERQFHLSWTYGREPYYFNLKWVFVWVDTRCFFFLVKTKCGFYLVFFYFVWTSEFNFLWFLWSTVFTFLCETHCFIEVSWELIVHFFRHVYGCVLYSFSFD